MISEEFVSFVGIESCLLYADNICHVASGSNTILANIDVYFALRETHLHPCCLGNIIRVVIYDLPWSCVIHLKLWLFYRLILAGIRFNRDKCCSSTLNCSHWLTVHFDNEAEIAITTIMALPPFSLEIFDHDQTQLATLNVTDPSEQLTFANIIGAVQVSHA